MFGGPLHLLMKPWISFSRTYSIFIRRHKIRRERNYNVINISPGTRNRGNKHYYNLTLWELRQRGQTLHVRAKLEGLLTDSSSVSLHT